MPKLEETLFGIAFLVFLHWPFTIPGSRYGIKGAVGGFLGTKPLICGGMKVQYDKDLKEYSDEYSDKCLLITPKKTEKLRIMQSKRFNAASLVLKGSILWVTGGNDGTNTLSSTEFIENKATGGPELPKRLEGHKMIGITDDLTLLIGGGYLKEATHEKTQIATTYYFNHDKTQHEKGIWSEGPPMQYKRRNHAVGIVTDRITLEKVVFVTGGEGEVGQLKSTEKLDTSWSEGESLLMSLKIGKYPFTIFDCLQILS